MTVNEYADHAGISMRNVRWRIHKGHIPFIKIGLRTMIDPEAADNAWAEHEARRGELSRLQPEEYGMIRQTFWKWRKKGIVKKIDGRWVMVANPPGGLGLHRKFGLNRPGSDLNLVLKRLNRKTKRKVRKLKP